MTESISTRLRRIASARMQSLIDQMEQASSPAVMAEAVREIERLMEEVARESDQATIRRLSAVRSQTLLRERLADLDKKAHFAMSEGREDLAEIALGRQMDFEASIAELDETIATTREEEERLSVANAELKQRRDNMADMLRACEAVQTEAARSAVSSSAPRARAADRAEKAFLRAMGGTAASVATAVANEETRKGLSELDQLSRRKSMSERMERLRASVIS